jgi:hypothetical protein
VTYIGALADEIRAEVPADIQPEDSDVLFLMYAVLLLAKGTDVLPADVHNAWAAWMSTRDEGHESLVPYEELSGPAKAEDNPFVTAIRRVAQRRSRIRGGPAP